MKFTLSSVWPNTIDLSEYASRLNNIGFQCIAESRDFKFYFTIEIKSVDELMKIEEELGHPLILYTNGDEKILEIYDDRRI